MMSKTEQNKKQQSLLGRQATNELPIELVKYLMENR